MARKKTQLVCPMCGEPVVVEGTCDTCKKLYAALTEGCGQGSVDAETPEKGGKEDGISET